VDALNDTEAQRYELAMPVAGFEKGGDGKVGIRFGDGSKPINTIFRGMNIHLPAILGFTRYQGFDPSPFYFIPEIVWERLEMDWNGQKMFAKNMSSIATN